MFNPVILRHRVPVILPKLAATLRHPVLRRLVATNITSITIKKADTVLRPAPLLVTVEPPQSLVGDLTETATHLRLALLQERLQGMAATSHRVSSTATFVVCGLTGCISWTAASAAHQSAKLWSNIHGSR